MEFRARPYYPKDNEIQPYYIKFAQAGSLLFMVGSILAMLLFPHYDIHEKYLSDLGIEQRSAFVFNNTVIASALILTPVFLGMYWYLLPLVDSRSHFMLGLGTITGVIGMVALIFVGYYPATGETLASHNFYAMLFFILLALSLFFLVSTVVYIIEQKDEEDPDPWLYAGYSYVPLVVLLSDMSTWYNKILQKIIVYSAIAFLLFIVNLIRKLPMDKEFKYTYEEIKADRVCSLDQVLILNRVSY